MAETGPFRSHVSAVQLAGRLLCWSLAAAMATAAVRAVAHPHARWWSAVWSLPWWLFCAAGLAWGVLRLREKAARRPPRGGVRSDWGQAA
ncbi:predicted protein [Streptomyces viridochromogenes DSM 40736]|uniref:Predicted protein n=1 Tax=Streptomyces viridochromogenes (strain DSM 40736 / JCM 4977 / BCRC 1201 / Tue 494) TaxID=591159 RepID=D9XCA0_STRVT|nr:hypothetical protein [Streptomyces viridochromogenes]EFL32357.1 predicted protein [Streptomyces viridochromogenes DSM 40736]